MGLLDNSSAAWARVQQVHTKFADWGVNSIKPYKMFEQEHLKLGIYHKKSGEKANATIDSSFNLVIDEKDSMDAFQRVLLRNF